LIFYSNERTYGYSRTRKPTYSRIPGQGSTLFGYGRQQNQPDVGNESNISIIGNNNRVLLHFESEDSAEELLTGAGFLLIVKGDGNEVDMGTVIVRCSSILGMTGLKLIIGQLPGLGAGVSRTANGCSVTIGDRVVINGVTLYLQEDHSRGPASAMTAS